MGTYALILMGIAAAVFVALKVYRHAFGLGHLDDGMGTAPQAHHVSSRNQWGFPTPAEAARKVRVAHRGTKEPWGW